MATGPSLNPADAELVRRSRHPTLAVNDAYRLAPWADVLYATDQAWWEHHEFVAHFPGQRWTQNRANRRHLSAAWQEDARANGLRIVESKPGADYPSEGQLVCDGGNSTFIALSFACIAGASRVIILGLDLGTTRGRKHFFGSHPRGLDNTSPFASFRRCFEHVAPQLAARGVEVLNCSRSTTLQAFERRELEHAL